LPPHGAIFHAKRRQRKSYGRPPPGWPTPVS